MRRWFIIECSRGEEYGCMDLLERTGFGRAWYPPKEKIEVRGRRQPGKPRFEWVAEVTGYLFLPAKNIDIYKMVERVSNPTANRWLRPLVINGKARAATDEEMAQMKQTPKRVLEIVDDIRRRAEAEREAKRPALGQRAKVISGPFEGQDGIVTALEDGEVKMTIEGWLPVTVAQDIVERV